jgi:hypothetical protein
MKPGPQTPGSLRPSLIRLGLRSLLVLLWVLAALPARGQDVYSREQRLVDIHALLLDLPPLNAPGAYAPGYLDLGLEVAAIPPISGDVGPLREITASDQARLFPRLRLALGLPAPAGFRIFVGGGYIPPVEINRITVNSLGGEAGIAYVNGALRIGLRGHGVLAHALSPVSAPNVRDRLKVADGGWDVSAGYELHLGKLSLTPYAGAGQVWSKGDFRSSVDGGTIHSTHAGATFQAGARALLFDHWEAVLEYSVYPGRVWSPRLRLGYVVHLGW